MFLSELKVGDIYSLDDDKIPWGQQFKVERIETIPADFTEETWYGVLDLITKERLRINNPDTVKVLKVDETRPRNIASKMFIKVKPTPPNVVHGIDFNFPVGHITYPIINVEKIEGCLLPEGQALKKEEYPELYAAVGDNFSLDIVAIREPKNILEKIKKFAGVTYATKIKDKKTTRNCGEDEFRIPDLRGQFLR